MPNAEHLGKYLEVLELVFLALLAVRLAALGLWRSYPIFFAYVVYQIPDGLWPLLVPVDGNYYLKVWVITEPVTMVFHILLVLELCRLILVRHPGIYSLGKWAMYAAVVLALLISLISLIPHITPRMQQQSNLLPYWFGAERGIDFGLAIFLLLMMAFLSRYPFRLNRNTLIHTGLYTFFFFAFSLLIFLHTFFGISRASDTATVVNTVSTAIQCACLLAWLLLLTREGETVQAAFPTYTAERETQILEKLDALNNTLMRAGGRR